MAVHGLLDPDPDDSTTDGRKAKRELSQSKRAAQNRAAQVSHFHRLSLSLSSVAALCPFGRHLVTRAGTQRRRWTQDLAPVR